MEQEIRRQFVDLIVNMRHGGAIDELDQELEKLVQAVRDTGRSGKLQLAIEIKPASTGNTSVLTIRDAIKVTAPTFKRDETIFFASIGNRLSRNDPRQPELPELRRVPGASAADLPAPGGTAVASTAPLAHHFV